jgi:hypothetical protein
MPLVKLPNWRLKIIQVLFIEHVAFGATEVAELIQVIENFTDWGESLCHFYYLLVFDE